jgi:hypothetical protein
MRVASAGKRFRKDMSFERERDPSFKFTPAQARYLWLLVDLYRRQIKDLLTRTGIFSLVDERNSGETHRKPDPYIW